ncbi:MAG: hypothetical protein PHC54_06980 [Candidatus Omnitrophica bacterium]|nr:hypothetical protein [Candidatus Omnitrophota bacterium]MDD5592966.1 hypothetical protein [Candidatus Omnitrophota bacterium]
MIFNWESREERLAKFMGISPKKKLEWLRQMHDFMRKALTEKQKCVYYKLREIR